LSAVTADRLPPQLLAYWAATTPDTIYLTQPLADGSCRTFTWAEASDAARRMAAHLQAQDWPRGSRVALLSKNSTWWFLADYAIWMAGHVSVPIYPSLTGDSVRYVLEHSEARALFLGNLDSSDRAAMLAGIPAGLPVIRLPNAGPLPAGNGPAADWETILAGTAAQASPVIRQPEELATIIYTSGTTGTPKGVMHTFASLAAATGMLSTVYGTGRDDRLISYLPLAHVADRIASELHSLATGCRVWFSLGLDSFTADLQRARPTFFFSVPRLWTKFRQAVNAKIPQAALGPMLADPVQGPAVRQQILAQLGLDATRIAMSGAAPIPPDLHQWYLDLGLELLEVYGMTENMAISHTSRSGKGRVGYVGQPCPGVQTRLDEANGELLVKSPGAMRGYFRDEARTAEAVTEDGYLRTGDVGSIDSQGYFRITGRAKETFKTAKGKYVAPAAIENQLGAHPAIEACCVAGLGFPQPFAMLMLSPAFAGQREDPATRATLTAALASLREQVNAQLDPHERLDFLVVVPDAWTVDNGLVTPTFKIKRAALEALYGSAFDVWAARREAVVWG
jgi:long-chain acyl-CoA synthetase